MFKISIILVFFFIVHVESHFDDCDDDSGDSDSHSHEYGGGGYGGYGGNDGGGGGNGGGGGGGSRWKRLNNGCGTGWIGFDRPTGRWCLKAFGQFYQPAVAEEKCGEFQAVLSAFMNSAEQQAVNDDALRAISPRTTGSIWLGLHRTQPCMNQNQTAQCTALNSFYYTDGSTTGTAGLVWDESQNQPDNSRGQACAAYFAARTAGQSLKHGKYFWLTQRLDDIQCNMATNQEGPRKVVGYLCGRKAE